jgi:methylphosphotriester-DNA--protein-cysteine methyltransferase
MIGVLKAEKESGSPTMTDDKKWHAVATKDPKTDGKSYYTAKTTGGNI